MTLKTLNAGLANADRGLVCTATVARHCLHTGHTQELTTTKYDHGLVRDCTVQA
jgi:hypothetical protein